MSRTFITPGGVVIDDGGRDYILPGGFLAGEALAEPPVGGPAGQAKVWRAGAWAKKPAKVWSGSAWAAKPVKVWTGSAWVPTAGEGSGPTYGPDQVLYGPGTNAPGGPSDPNTFMVGTRMTVLNDGRITHFRYWQHSGNPSSRYVTIWSDTGTLLASATATGAVNGWNTFPLTTPLLVTANQIIRAAYGNTGSATFGSFAFDLTAPPIPSGADLRFEHGVYTTPQPSGADTVFPENIIVPNHYYGDVVYQKRLT